MNWNEQESEQRMRIIGQNGNDGLHYYKDLTPEEGMEIVLKDAKLYDEQLVTDYIMIAGYTTEEAYAAADLVDEYDDLF